MDRHFHPKPSTANLESDLAELQSQAERGDADAQLRLGLHYSNAKGKAPDFALAVRWYLKAAEQNHPLAQFNLAVMCARGQGMQPDEAAAANWMRRAAEGGDAGGQYQLGVRCHRASLDPLRAGGGEFRIEAYKWFHLAAAQGYNDSLTARQRITLSMTRAEVDEGNQRAAAFVVRSSSPHFLEA